jgi:hypothetical protein
VASSVLICIRSVSFSFQLTPNGSSSSADITADEVDTAAKQHWSDSRGQQEHGSWGYVADCQTKIIAEVTLNQRCYGAVIVLAISSERLSPIVSQPRSFLRWVFFEPTSTHDEADVAYKPK